MRVKFKPWAEEYLRNLTFHKYVDDFEVSDIKSAEKIVLEIGVGKGDYLLNMALRYPSFFFIGIELNASVLSVAAKKIEEKAPENLLIITGDAKDLLAKLQPESLDFIVLNHSDPWPKKRHEKRRLTSLFYIKEYYKLLKKEGTLIFKTDNEDFATYSFITISGVPFSEVQFIEDYTGGYNFDTQTEYEQKFRSKGVKIRMIIGKK